MNKWQTKINEVFNRDISDQRRRDEIKRLEFGLQFEIIEQQTKTNEYLALIVEALNKRNSGIKLDDETSRLLKTGTQADVKKAYEQ